MTSKTDPVCGMPGVIERRGHWFCGESCAAEFARRSTTGPRRLSRLRDPWIWVPLSGTLISTMGRWWPAAGQVSAIYAGYLQVVLAPLLVGLLLGGLIDHFIPREYIIAFLSGSKKRVIVRSTLLGFLASSCSHGCLALSLELYRKGASTPAVVSFLLASPWASMSLTFILVGLFGLKGLTIIGCALGIAFTTGLIFQQLARSGLIESNPQTVPVQRDFSVWRDLAARWRRAVWTPRQLVHHARGIVTGMLPLGRMVLGWVQLGFVLSSLVGALIPHGVFERFFGPSLLGLLLTLLAATLIEVCSEGTGPLAFELYRHTGALGNAFALLMAGVITDYTELGAVWATIGRRTVLWIVVITLPLVLFVGMLLNLAR